MIRNFRSADVMQFVRYSGDADVQAFVEDEVANISPYSHFLKTARQLRDAARAMFGPRRCRDLVVPEH